MHFVGLIAGFLATGAILWDAFEAIVLPRPAMSRMRLAQSYYRVAWTLWTGFARRMSSERRRERFLAVFGPLAFIGLLAVWAAGLVTGCALLHWSTRALVTSLPGDGPLFDDFYLSGTTLFTLGLGDVVPHNRASRLLAIGEAGTGLMFLTMVLAYLPVLYGSFSRREVRVTLLDAWAGSPPATAEILERLARAGDLSPLVPFLKEWEHWCSDLLESHLSHPTVAYFRSQHKHQSWVAALTTVLDVSALVKTGLDGVPTWQAHLTFAIARHAAVDLTCVLDVSPDPSGDRLPPGELEGLRRALEEAGLTPNRSAAADRELAELRRSYEPYVIALSKRLMMPLPPWHHVTPAGDNWRTDPRRDGGPHF